MGIEEIWDITKREFGFVFKSFGGKNYMKRKFTFDSHEALVSFIRDESPLDCYVSVAYYKYPAQMEGWSGASLFFDIDCEENLKLAYADAITVYESLLDDFALKEVSLRFSGSKGYHVIAQDVDPRILDVRARCEIVDYLVGTYNFNVLTVDSPASCDIKRLRRIAGTVNSKSGELCKILKVSK
ncbi:MAG: hypothetical protein H8D26_09570 [Methanomicrobia archaeon]|nr:hypothetical protein [Methanomicrobia archaeon]